MFLLLYACHVFFPQKDTNMASPYKLYKFGDNSANNPPMKNSRDLILSKVVYISIIYPIPEFWYLFFAWGWGFWYIFLENVKIPTLCPTHPLGLGIDGCISVLFYFTCRVLASCFQFWEVVLDESLTCSTGFISRIALDFYKLHHTWFNRKIRRWRKINRNEPRKRVFELRKRIFEPRVRISENDRVYCSLWRYKSPTVAAKIRLTCLKTALL